MKRFWWLCGCLAAVLPLQSANAADFAVKVTDQAPPKELAEVLRPVLQAKATQVLKGDQPAFEFWFAKQIPLKSKPASLGKALDSLAPATLLGAVSVAAATRDYRDDELPAGVYTMRFALQPQDGDHSGTTDYTYFAVLTPATLDTAPDAITTYKALVKASGKGTSSNHPHVMSLRPASSEPGEQPQIKEPAPEHRSLLLKLPARAGDEQTSLAFEFVCEGHIKK